MRGGAGPPSRLSWLPPAFGGEPRLRQPQRLGGLGGEAGLRRRGEAAGAARVGEAGRATPWGGERASRHPRSSALEAGSSCVFLQLGLPTGTCRSGPGRCLGVGGMWEGRGSVPSGCRVTAPWRRLSRGSLRGFGIRAACMGPVMPSLWGCC